MRVAWLFVVATGCSRSSAGLQPPTRWAKPVDAAAAWAEAHDSKALACLFRDGVSLASPLQYDVSPDLIRAMDQARADYSRGTAGAASSLALGGFGTTAMPTTMFVLGALGRAAEAHTLIAAEPANQRVALDRQLIVGLLYSSAPADSLDDATAALMHDTGGDPDEYRVSLYTAAAEMRAAGYASHARSLRHYLISYVISSGDQALLRDEVAPEVFAAGDDDEMHDVDAVADKLFSNGRAALEWSRAYYRRAFAVAFARTRDELDPDVRRSYLLRLWARAATEGFDPDATHAIDDLACAAPR